VEEVVLSDEISDVAVGPRIEAVATGPEQRDDVLGDTRSGAPCSVALEQSAELVQILESFSVVDANGRAAVGSGVHEAFGLKEEQRLPHGRAADAELAREPLLLEARARRKTPINDGLPNHLRGDVARVANERLPVVEDLRHAFGEYSMQTRFSGAARGGPAVGDYRWRVESEAIAREQRRRLAREALEFEVGREAALGDQLQETIAELEGPAIDERVFARMAPEDVELVRAALGDDPADEFDAEGDEWFVEEEDEAEILAEDRESEISRLEGEIRDSRRRQAALQRYLEALEADSSFEA
jgi:hypothetical protein